MSFSNHVQFFVLLNLFSIYIVLGQEKYAIRMINAYSPPDVANAFVVNETVVFMEGPAQYINCSIHVIGKHTMKRGEINIQQCNSEGYSCEYFMKWNFPSVCSVIKMKNQMWTPLIDSVHPKINCNNLQGSYKVVRATLDADQMMVFNKDGFKHRKHFKVDVAGYNPKNVKVVRFVIHFSIFKYNSKTIKN